MVTIGQGRHIIIDNVAELYFPPRLRDCRQGVGMTDPEEYTERDYATHPSQQQSFVSQWVGFKEDTEDIIARKLP